MSDKPVTPLQKKRFDRNMLKTRSDIAFYTSAVSLGLSLALAYKYRQLLGAVNGIYDVAEGQLDLISAVIVD